ncbi:MAG: flagellar M-ring protein FliF [Gammaproteobacteria bacterium]|nr:flagellar M-ring protein FliF [Gammaproteobacteria bacterium]
MENGITENNLSETGEKAQLQVLQLSQHPVVRQLGVMIGIAASVALGVAVVLWSQSPSYSLLYGNLDQKDASEIVEALTQSGIDYKIDEATGAIMVVSGQVQEARMKLAGQGLPHDDSLGFELLQQETGFGTSRAMEAARFHRALEGELARTIATLANIENARVHLAMPKQSVFLRERKKPSASVMLKLRSGRKLEKSQVAAITHLVASSVPELETTAVTLVDHKGEMLSGPEETREMQLTASQFEYTQKQEEHYRQRVENILAPIVGVDKLRAQVTAELDFSVTEQTSEMYNPDVPALRSEHVDEQASRLGAAQGIPGALSNQPPAAGIAPERARGGADQAEDAQLSSSKRSTRNFELDKTISHTRLSTGKVRRLSVAVVIDDKTSINSEGTEVQIERSPEEVNRITQLVKEAIGFNAARGDSVRVINASFTPPDEMEPLPEPALWEQPWFLDLVKQIGGLLLVLILIFFVLRPTMQRLTARPGEEKSGEKDDDTDEEEGTEEDAQVAGALPDADAQYQLPGPESYLDALEKARQMVGEDPKRVAQVIKTWMAEDAGH